MKKLKYDKKGLLLLCFVVLAFVSGYSQCPTSITATTTESRCRESGTIKVNATPAGTYMYEITAGPTLSGATTSNTFTSLGAGTYEITVSKGSCFTKINATVSGSYIDPGLLNATSTAVTCPGGTACLTMTTPINGRSPYNYSIISGPVTRAAQNSPVFCGLHSRGLHNTGIRQLRGGANHTTQHW